MINFDSIKLHRSEIEICPFEMETCHLPQRTKSIDNKNPHQQLCLLPLQQLFLDTFRVLGELRKKMVQRPFNTYCE